MSTHLTNQTTTRPTTWQAFLQGVKDEAPLLLGVLPFGLIYGVIVNNAHISGSLGQAMSTIIFAGSAQLITARLFGEGAPLLVIVATAAIVNLRHLLYSASIAPYLREAGSGWKGIIAYLLTDEAYAMAITRFQNDPSLAGPLRYWYFFGAGSVLWITWHISTAIGIFLSGQIPTSWGLDFSVPLTFLAIVIPALRDRAGIVAAIAAGLASILLVGLPLKLGMLTAILVGIVAGSVVDGKK